MLFFKDYYDSIHHQTTLLDPASLNFHIFNREFRLMRSNGLFHLWLSTRQFNIYINLDELLSISLQGTRIVCSACTCNIRSIIGQIIHAQHVNSDFASYQITFYPTKLKLKHNHGDYC